MDLYRNCRFYFEGKVVFVTGGCSGIGKAVARAFANSGAWVTVLDINDPDPKEKKDVLIRYKKVDVSKEGKVKRAVSAALKEWGVKKVHALVNNAGIEFNDVGNLIDMPYDKLKRIIDVNLYGYINCARAVVPHMEQGSCVVNVGSVQGQAAHRPGTSYQATKSGIMGLTRALAIELADRGITVNTVLPGAIATEGMGAVRSGGSDILNSYRRRIPLGRRGRPEEVAGPILFLCSELASYITGAELRMDGGYLADITPDFGGATIIRDGDPDKPDK